MIDRQGAIAILQEHINTYRYQTTDKGWEQMVRTGIVGNTIPDKIGFIAEAEKQIQAYEMAIKALESGAAEAFVDRCYLGSPCPYQMRV
ncbi:MULTISPECIES: hypothetical protein [Clostridia]|uniref:hypothetical protein n=1 Tax=Clostridium sp. TaxID=1506 RepID=UPI00258E83BF|nr:MULTISPECIES: hypothetical protein [Clostridia]MCI6140920.1 hypothetical protein [Clostridium sp.]MDY4764113.1 hypothetical protein [Enterocloster clostridioformis]